VEISHGSELITARISTDLIIEMKHTFKMLGMKVEESSLLLGDNMSVVLNTIINSSILKKKHNVIAYQNVREGVATRIIKFAHIDYKENISEIMTKCVNKTAFYHLTKKCLF